MIQPAPRNYEYWGGRLEAIWKVLDRIALPFNRRFVEFVIWIICVAAQPLIVTTGDGRWLLLSCPVILFSLLVSIQVRQPQGVGVLDSAARFLALGGCGYMISLVGLLVITHDNTHLATLLGWMTMSFVLVALVIKFRHTEKAVEPMPDEPPMPFRFDSEIGDTVLVEFGIPLSEIWKAVEHSPSLTPLEEKHEIPKGTLGPLLKESHEEVKLLLGEFEECKVELKQDINRIGEKLNCIESIYCLIVSGIGLVGVAAIIAMAFEPVLPRGVR